jgi:ActR/RegA family two-component response regulator
MRQHKQKCGPDMNYSLRACTDTPQSVTYPEVLPGSSRLADHQPDQSTRYVGPLQTLRRVSGRLSKFFHGREKLEVAQPRRLLVVDDEESICFSMKEYFTHHGFTVETASEVEQAERMIRQGQYEVIIQDLRLGTTANPDGLDIIRLTHECSPETRIVVLTAYGSSEVETEAKESGADAFLRKPQPLSQVAQVVRGLLESPRRWAIPQH